jgi:hypothetical protein
MKTYRVEQFKLEGWEDVQSGLIVEESKQWILLKYIPVDYVIDGYKLINKKYISERLRENQQKKVEKVLKLKGIDTNTPEGFKFGNTEELLSWTENHYELFEFSDDLEHEVFYGRINRVEANNLIIDFIDANGKERKKWDHFNIDKIRVIAFDSDYFNSIKLLWKDSKNKKRLTTSNSNGNFGATAQS